MLIGLIGMALGARGGTGPVWPTGNVDGFPNPHKSRRRMWLYTTEPFFRSHAYQDWST